MKTVAAMESGPAVGGPLLDDKALLEALINHFPVS